MRFLKEIFRPSLKCERKGHKFRTERRSGIRDKGRRAILPPYSAVKEKRVICIRCRDCYTDWEEVDSKPIDSLSLPSEDWAKLERDGELFR